MAKKSRWRTPEMKSAVARYAPAFREVHDAITHQHQEKLKSLQSMSDRVITKFGLERPTWMTAEYLKKSREQVNRSQVELAGLAGISRSIIANWEAGVIAPGLETADKVYDALEKEGSVLAVLALRDISDMEEEASLESLQMIDREFRLLTEHQKSLHTHLEECRLEKARIDARVMELTWGSGKVGK